MSKLPEGDPKYVDIYLLWLYTFNLPKPKLKQSGVWEALVDLYVVGEKLQDPTLKNCNVSAFIVNRRYTTDCR